MIFVIVGNKLSSFVALAEIFFLISILTCQSLSLIFPTLSVRLSIGSMDFDNPEVYGDTAIFDGLVFDISHLVGETCAFVKEDLHHTGVPLLRYLYKRLAF